MFWAGLFFFGVAIGVVSGLLGIGGGVLLVPGLILMFGFSQAEAQGTSLAVLIPPIGIFAAIVYYQHGYVHVPIVGMLALGIMVGAYAGAMIVPHLSPVVLRMTFGVLMLYLGFVFVLDPSGRSMNVALLAGLATIVTAIVAWVMRRRFPPKKILPPPGPGSEYHI